MDSMVRDADVPLEYNVVRERNNVVVWSRYLSSKRGPGDEVNLAWLYERCLKELPSEWPIWREYLTWRIQLLEGCDLMRYEKEFERVVELFEDCVKSCRREPEAWTKYLEFLITLRDLKRVRLCLNQAIQALDWEYHTQVWNIVFNYLSDQLLDDDQQYHINLPDCIDHLLLKTQPSFPVDIWSSKIIWRYSLVTDDIEPLLLAVSKTNDWNVIKEMYSKHLSSKFLPLKLSLYDHYSNYLTALFFVGDYPSFSKVVEICISQFPTQKAELEKKQVLYRIYRGEFVAAREKLENITTKTRDINEFASIYDFWVLLEESLIGEAVRLFKNKEQKEAVTFEFIREHVALLSELLEKHSLRLNDLALRKNPNNITLWQERVKLFTTDVEKAGVYATAVTSIDYKLQETPGSLGELWCSYCELFLGDEDNFRILLDRATNVPFKFLTDIEKVWTFWAEKELDKNGPSMATEVLREALKVPDNYEFLLEQFQNGKISSRSIVFSSSRLWLFYLDLLESQGEFGTIRDAYEKAILIKVATPVMFINYAQFLHTLGSNSESLSIYERAVNFFPPETSFHIWNFYIKDALSMDLPTEHMREIFDSATKLSSFSIDCTSFFKIYCDFELKLGYFERSVDILRRASTQTSDINNKVNVWSKCLSISKDHLGVHSTRALYEECIQILPNTRCVEFVLDFARLEIDNREYARARSILEFGGQLLKPSQNEGLWEVWKDFETQHGDKNTFKTMLRTKRYLEDSMQVNTELISHQGENIKFVASSAKKGNFPDIDKKNSSEIDLNI